METEAVVLDCGCEYITTPDGKVVWIFCDEHEVENNIEPVRKFRYNFEHD